ncbi:hypothetical protein F53441_8647 [Fusarium austroafricanum]|uniref:Uncharacterized protein n=1 Tax=Fusarium austroafricanum TaxID=2364996 RepID=A0A8H4P4D1_9HYPO|nr:hypothetical protein F53441_8647 [Fusarium austroafricanum]
MVRNILRTLFGPSPPSPFSELDSLSIHRKIVKAGINEKDVILHCHLLEHFVSIKPKIDIWAMKNMIDPAAAWTCYINMGVRRLTNWFRASYDGIVKLDRHIPPLDVLLVWHAFLEDPVAWERFIDDFRLDFTRWNRDELSRALDSDEHGLFCPSLNCIDKINLVYRDPDARTLMNMSLDYIFTARPNSTTQQLIQLFSQKKVSHIIKTRRGQRSFSFDFHAAVQRQIDLAERDVNFSWHRIHASRWENEQGMKPAIKRYRRYMTLSRFRTGIASLQFEDTDHLKFVDFDIHLVWRTHKLVPHDYRWFCDRYFGGLVYEIPAPLDSYELRGPLLTSKDQVYEYVFGEEYALCLCWPCVKGRTDGPPGWRCLKRLTRPSVKTQLAAEIDRRRATAVSIPLEFAEKQCRKCGSHPRRRCRKKDMAEVLTTEPPTLRHPVAGCVPTPGTSIIMSVSTPGQSEPAPVPFRDLGMFPYGSEILAQTPLQTPLPPHAPASAPNSEAPEPVQRDRNMELRDCNRSHATTPDLTIGSSRSGYNSDEERSPSYYTLQRTLSLYQIPPIGIEFLPRTEIRNADATRDDPRGRSRVPSSNGPEPGAWLAG